MTGATPTRRQAPDEDREYLRSWARKLAACGKRTLREAHAAYLEGARDVRRSASERRLARRRARFLARWLDRATPRPPRE